MKNNTINKNNVEFYLASYLEGELTSDLQAELLLFLDRNPALLEEQQLIAEVRLIPSQIAYPLKNSLKKDEALSGAPMDYFDLLCIESMEGDIGDTERERLHSILLEDASLAADYKLFLKAKLIPNSVHIYKGKSQLKRTAMVGLSFSKIKIIATVAASIAFVLSTNIILQMFYFKQKNEAQINKEQNDKPITSLPRHTSILQIEPFNATSTDEKPSMRDTGKMQFRDKIPPLAIETNHVREAVEYQYIEPRVAMLEISTGWIPAITEELLATRALLYDANGESPLDYGSSIHTRVVGFFELTQMGISMLAEMTESSAQLSAEKDEQGQIKRIHFQTNLFAISTPIAKK